MNFRSALLGSLLLAALPSLCGEESQSPILENLKQQDKNLESQNKELEKILTEKKSDEQVVAGKTASSSSAHDLSTQDKTASPERSNVGTDANAETKNQSATPAKKVLISSPQQRERVLAELEQELEKLRQELEDLSKEKEILDEAKKEKQELTQKQSEVKDADKEEQEHEDAETTDSKSDEASVFSKEKGKKHVIFSESKEAETLGDKSLSLETKGVGGQKKISRRVLSRRQRRTLEKLDIYNISGPKDLKDQADIALGHKKYLIAARRYDLLLQWFPDFIPEEEALCQLAGLFYLGGKPEDALVHMKIFGKKFPDSPLITRMVALAYEIGRGFSASEIDIYDLRARQSYAVEAFQFVRDHDPYSMDAAEAAFSSAFIHMKKNEWNEAIFDFTEIIKNHPYELISEKAGLGLGEAYLGFNKGSDYSKESCDRAIERLERFLNEYYSEDRHSILERDRAKSLLAEAYRRVAVREMKTARFYCSQRKWATARFYLYDILDNKKLSPVHEEAKLLFASIKDR